MKKTVRTIEITWKETTTLRVERRRGVAADRPGEPLRRPKDKGQGEAGEKPAEHLEISK